MGEVINMSLRKIRIDEDPVLRKKAKEIKHIDEDIKKLIDDMSDTMYEAPGVGLAAPQVGVSKRLVMVDVGDGQGLQVFINPKIIKKEGELEEGLEGCLSVPGIYGDVKRQLKITVKAINRKGKGITVEASAFRARAIQHEIDHLDGILFTDKAVNLHKKEDIEEELEEKHTDDRLVSLIQEIKEKRLKISQ
jgi:peptide deformylase